MKAKIFVSSSTSLDQISHSYSITVIPDIVVINGEEYDDFKEISPISFYTRLKFDKKINAKILHRKYDYLNDLFLQAKEQGYTDFIFVLSSLELDMISDVTKVQKEHPDDKIYIYQARSVSYLLGMIVQEADKNLKNQISVEKVFEEMDLMQSVKNSDFALFKPEITEIRSPFNLDSINLQSRGVSFVYSNNNFIQIGKLDKNGENPFKDFIKNFLLKNEGKNYTPILLISNKNSIYYSYLKEVISTAFPKLKQVKEIYLAPSLEIDFKDALGITFVIK